MGGGPDVKRTPARNTRCVTTTATSRQRSPRRATSRQRSPRRSVARAPRLACESELLRRYHVGGDKAARDELVRRLLPLARRLARRYSHGGSAHDDLFQVASLGLVKAIDRFDLERGTTLARFAVPTMLGELKRHLRDTRWALRVPRELQERSLEVSRVTQELGASLGRRPRLADIARNTGLDVEEVAEAMVVFSAMEPASIDAPITADDGESIPHEALLGEYEAGYDQVEASVALETGFAVLSEEERKVLRLRFISDLTQSEIGRRLGVSQMYVCRTIRRALERVRNEAQVPVSA